MSRPARDVRVLFVDDDDTFRRVMSSALARRGYEVNGAATGAEALDRVSDGVDVAVLDLRLPDMDGVELLERLREREPQVGVVMLTAQGTIDTAIRATRLGAHDYLEKPCPIEKLDLAIQKTCDHVRVLSRQRVLEDGYAVADVGSGLVGASPAFRKLSEAVCRIARTDATALILGETGVGKDVVARLLHAGSLRRDAPFVVVDCAALHEELLQSELFGHEQGAFTGANRRKHGLFEVANRGTLFLDEVGDASLDIQAKLLRVLESGRFRRLGGTVEVGVDVRVVAATNRDLREAITRGRFREDLFYRLATLTLEIPPLRERAGDVPLLVQHYLGRLNQRFGVAKRMSASALATLERHDWPGNVRELIHVLEQAIVMCERDVIGVGDLPRGVGGGAATGPEPETTLTLREAERRHVRAVLEHAGGNRARAARLLGLSERTLYRLLERHRRAEAASSEPDA